MGRDASPVLDKYPPKDPALAPRGPPRPPTAPVAPPSGAALHPGAPANPSPATVPTSGAGATASTSPPPLTPLLSLERPFDPDEFAQQLGETLIEVKVPRDQLAEVLRRVAEFMGFGIYVYEIAVRPAPTELLNDFVVTLRRVDFQPARSGWVPFEEKGRSDSPFGPEGRR
ncbi:MAG TPA: hypothetical protein VMH90_00735 [Thermoplasmata archaeon]|nr:hypothetical protein [Thermoplasmata archaeon]